DLRPDIGQRRVRRRISIRSAARAGEAPGFRHDASIANPIFEPTAFGERRELAAPEATDGDHAGIAAAGPFGIAIGDTALTELRDVILQPHEIDARFVDIA